VKRRDFNWGAVASVGAVTLMSSETTRAATQPMMSLNVVYPNHEGARFDVDYYRTSHIPLAMKVMKAAKVVLIEGVPSGDKAPPIAMICHFQFSSAEALAAASADPGMAEVRADVAKFTDIKPMVMVGRTV
jgi:uncharacterized protein (TIGR02118 family)